MPLEHDDSFQGAYFALEIDGLDLGFFTGCSGLNVEFDKMEQKGIQSKGTVKTTVKVPGRAKYGDITLKRGFTQSTTLSDWFNEVVDAAKATPYKTGAVVVYSRTKEEVARFSLLNMWPSKFNVSNLTAGSDELMVEEMTIKHEFLEWV